MPKNTLIIAGPRGGASTVLGGLRQYVDTGDDVASIGTVVVGNSQPYQRNIERLFTHGRYPEAGDDGYVVSYELYGGSTVRPELTVSAVHPPGRFHWGVGHLSHDEGALARIRSGTAPNPEAVRERYERNIEPELEQGRPTTPDAWETVLLHHYYTADRVLFLLNLHTVLRCPEVNPAYGAADIESAAERFESVAVVPTAVDLLGYDPDADDRGLLRRVAARVFSSGIRDVELLEHLHDNLSIGGAAKSMELLRHVATNESIDFFGVAVPEEGSPQEYTGTLTPDSEDAFESQGFETMVEWLRR